MISLRSERDKFALEANFAREKLDRFMKEFEHQVILTNPLPSLILFLLLTDQFILLCTYHCGRFEYCCFYTCFYLLGG